MTLSCCCFAHPWHERTHQAAGGAAHETGRKGGHAEGVGGSRSRVPLDENFALREEGGRRAVSSQRSCC